MLIFALIVSKYDYSQCAFLPSSRSLFFTLLDFSAVMMKSAQCLWEMLLHLLWLPRKMMSWVCVVERQGYSEENFLPNIEHLNILEPYFCISGKMF